MNGRKVFSNEKRLLRIACLIWALWTICFVFMIPAAVSEVDAGKYQGALIRISRSDVYWMSFIVWGAGSCGIWAALYCFYWTARCQIDYQGNMVEVIASWPKKQLFVNGELQDENTDYSISQVDLHGRVKSGEATGHQVRVSFAAFGTSPPIRVTIDDAVVFKG